MTTLHTVAATGALKLSWLLLAFPLFGAVVLLLGGRRTNRWGHLLGVAMPVAAFVYGLVAFFTLLGECLDNGSVPTSLLDAEIARGHIRSDAHDCIAHAQRAAA